MFGMGWILFIAVFVSISTKGCLRACNTKGAAAEELSQQPEPRHLNSIEMEAFKHLFLSKLGLTKPPSRNEVANYSAIYNRPAVNLDNLDVVYDQEEQRHNGIRRRERRAKTAQVVSFYGKGTNGCNG